MKVIRSLAEEYLTSPQGSAAEATAVRRQLAKKTNLTIEVPDDWVAKTASSKVLTARANPETGFDALVRPLPQDWGG